jgi:hypothetical protein
MIKKYYSLIGLIILIIAGCQKDPYPYITLKDVKKIDSARHPLIKNIAFIYKNNIYYAADIDQPVKQITTNGSAFKFVKMTHAHNKFAYMNASNRIVVVDDKGSVITTLAQYTQVKSFDWSADDKTLYILNGDAMAYYGPTMNLPAIAYPGIINGSTEEVLSASVSMKGDFAYVVHGFSFLYGDKYELVIQPANNGKVIVYTTPDDNVYITMDYVNFSATRQDLVVGYKEQDTNSDTQQKLIVFTDLKSFPDFKFGGSADAHACTPVYNSNLNYFVGGFVDTNDNNIIEPSAIYLGEGSMYTGANVTQSKRLKKYAITAGDMYTDWK